MQHLQLHTLRQRKQLVANYAPTYLILQYLIFASALCLSLAYPLEHQYYEESHGYEHLAHHEPEPIHEYGHHQIERISLGEEHGHLEHAEPHYETHESHGHDEHVDYYVSIVSEIQNYTINYNQRDDDDEMLFLNRLLPNMLSSTA